MNQFRTQIGMTLIEIMIVIMIMASIATGVAVGAMKMYREAQIDQAELDVSALKTASHAFRLGNARDCPTLELLVEEELLEGDTRKQDPWGTDFIIECTESRIKVYSAGPDGVSGTEDDIH